MHSPVCPSLYQIKKQVTRVGTRSCPCTEASRNPGRHSGRGAGSPRDNGLGLLSVWQTVPQGSEPRDPTRSGVRRFQETLPDLSEEDIAGSGFAITGYTVHDCLGGDAALARLRERLPGAACGYSSISSPTTRAWIILVNQAPSYSFGTDRTSHRRLRTTPGSLKRAAICWARDPYFAVGRTRCSSTTPTRHTEAMISQLVKKSPRSVMACDATWPCRCCQTCSNARGAAGRHSLGRTQSGRVREDGIAFSCFGGGVYRDARIDTTGSSYAATTATL